MSARDGLNVMDYGITPQPMGYRPASHRVTSADRSEDAGYNSKL
jgi:hypothetical protein